jgi:Pyridine nucleotide-disulphide oxidoreductase
MSESLMANSGHFDLCVVGAGYAGLNAAIVASQYLPGTARVLVLDKHQQAGGMWNDAYSYVRLHQPYQMFTVGNIAWSLGRERSYLATRDEVAAHLRHCLDVISERLDVDARWGWECLDHTEHGSSVVVTARGPDGEVRTVTAERFIDATGFDIESIDPLPVASRHVRSIAPRELEDSGLMSDDHTEPVWVIGSGKTAMDTIVAVARANPARRIGMVTGTGTYFLNRDLVNANGLKRWTGGVRYNAIFAGAAKRFDGTNAAEVSEWCRMWCGTSPLGNPAPTHLLFALQSEDETATVTTGVSEVIRDHLADVVDDDSGPVMLLRTGARHSIPSGSWVINCTGHITPREAEHVPYVSPSGRAMSINSTSTTFGNSAVSTYFLSHLFFLDRLAGAPLYEVDLHGLLRNAPEAALAVWSSLIMYNLSLVSERVPLKAFRDNGLDFDRWYPPVRRFAGQLQFIRNHKRDRQHHRQALDTFSRLTNVRCGPLSRAPSAR